jgi:TolA-binding protein
MKRLLLMGLALAPALLMGQKKEELQSIQRDVAQLQEQVKELQRSQDAKIGQLQSMLQQAVDASNKVSTGLTAMEREVSAKLNEQQTKLVAPVATLGAKVDQMSDDFRSVATNVQDLVRRMGALDSKLADISSAIRTLSSPPPAPVPAGGTAPQAGLPPGMSAETMWQNAFRDYSGGKQEIALTEFMDYVKNFPDTENAPNAQWYIGYMYFNAGQYDDAVKAFDAVLKMPENPKTPEALYYKGVSLMKGERRTEAGTTFRDFLKRYPSNQHIANVHQHLRTLGLEPRATSKKRD